jgi:hypothetical protein
MHHKTWRLILKFADIPMEITRPPRVRAMPVALVPDGSTLTLTSVRKESVARLNGTTETRFIAVDRDGNSYVISQSFFNQLIAAFAYAREHGETAEEREEIVVTLGSVAMGKIKRRVLL